MAKLSHGICDNLLTQIFRAWDLKSKNNKGFLKKPIILAPAMNSFMYDNPITDEQIIIL